MYRERCGWGVAGPVTLPRAEGLAWAAETRTGWLPQVDGIVPEATVVVQGSADQKREGDAMQCAVYREQFSPALACARSMRAAGDARR
ncbi:MAG: hypothetical protein RJA70_4356 [Pseudomonadota bacterium]